VNAQYTYLFVGYADDKSGALYLNSLHGLVETMRYGHPRKVKTQVRLAANPGQLRDLLTEGADLLIYGGHGGIEDDRPYLGRGGDEMLYLDQVRREHGPGITATGIVFDCCTSGTERFVAGVSSCLDGEAAYLGCNGLAPYTHGSLLLPILLAQLACPGRPPAPNAKTYLRALKQTLQAAKDIRHADWERWIAEHLRPAPAAIVTAPALITPSVP
jgi:hypothetical protein